MTKVWTGKVGGDPVCPHCGAILDGASAPGSDGPRSGDLSVCLYCEGASIYTEGYPWLRALTPAEQAESQPDLDRARAVVRQVRRDGRLTQRQRNPRYVT